MKSGPYGPLFFAWRQAQGCDESLLEAVILSFGFMVARGADPLRERCCDPLAWAGLRR